MSIKSTNWIGPFRFEELLSNVLEPSRVLPPNHPSVYIVSLKHWKDLPAKDSGILYVGGNTSDSSLFRNRIGDLLADLFGFYREDKEGGKKGHHSGGQKLHRYCLDKQINPLSLFIGWAVNVYCHRCAENYYYDELKPKLNKKRPAKCKDHNQMSTLSVQRKNYESQKKERVTGKTKVLPLKKAYPFGEKHGLAEKIDKIKNLPACSSSARRGFIIRLFEKEDIFEEFVQKF